MVHERISQLLKELDIPAPDSASPIQFYKLKNTKAADLLGTISDLLGEGSAQPAQSTTTPGPDKQGSFSASPAPASTGRMNGDQPSAPFSEAASSRQATGLPTSALQPDASSTPGSFSGNSDLHNASPVLSPAGSNSNIASPGALSVHSKGATVAADVNSNSIIVVGPPATQQMYADLIHRLDQRRPQVQIECTIVTLDTTNNITFGVDIGRLGGSDTSQLLTLKLLWHQHGQPRNRHTHTQRRRRVVHLRCLARALPTSSFARLETNTHARLVSAPQLLVNDNGKGKLQSVAQEPFAVILDASSTQSLTSLGGLAQAGTSISVEPHISEADYLQLAYSIELSNFTGDAQNGLPPPSQKNSVDSSVTIPDGYTHRRGWIDHQKLHDDGQHHSRSWADIPILEILFRDPQPQSSGFDAVRVHPPGYSARRQI